MSVAAISQTVPTRLDILVVEDEPAILESINCALGDQGHRVTLANDGEQAMQRLDAHHFDLTICDLRLPKVDGIEVFRRIRREQPDGEVILMSAYAGLAENFINEKAIHYLAKPFNLDLLVNLVDQVAGQRLHGSGPEGLTDAMAGSSAAIEALRRRIAALAIGDGAVLITGETGTGKELAARLIHQSGPRADRPFVAVAAAHLDSSELPDAQGGTLFIDDVAQLSSAAQAKLLRAMQDRQLGARVIAATSAELGRRAEQGSFRADLLDRLKAFPLSVPPLRERVADFPVLVREFYRKAAGTGDGMVRISPRAWAALRHHKFPGNVRELKQAIENAVALAKGGEIDLDHLPAEIARGAEPVAAQTPLQPLGFAIKEFEREYLIRALQRCDWQRTRTAAMLGISRKTLWQKLRQHGVAESEGH